MKKKIQGIIGAMAIAFSVSVSVPIAGAFDISLVQQAQEAEDWECRNPLAWVQSEREDMAIPRSQITTMLPTEEGERSVGAGGCTFYSHLAMLMRAGIWNPREDGTIVDFVNDCKAKGMPIEKNDGMFPWSEITTYYPNVHLVSAVTTQNSTEWKTVTDLEQFCQRAYGRGDYVVAYLVTGLSSGTGTVSGHAIFIDSVKSDGSISVIDSSSPTDDITNKDGVFGEVLEGNGGKSAPVVAYMFEYNIEGTDSRKTNTLWERFSGGLDADAGVINKHANDNAQSTEDKVKEETQQNEIQQLIDEYDAIDWRPTQLLTNQMDMDLTWYQNELTQKEKEKLEDIHTNIKADEFNLSEFLQKAILFFGLVLCIYGSFLIVASLFDMAVPFFDLSLVTILTFGKFHIRTKDIKDEEHVNRKKFISRFMFFMYCGFLIGLGMLIASGRLQEWVLLFADKIQTLLNS